MARDINLLHPTVLNLAQKLISESEKKGLKIMITDTLRTKAEQDALYSQGRSTAGSIVTNAKYPQSNHCWGIAFDICRNDGKGAYNNEGSFFEKVGLIGKSMGLSWGGDFTSIKDRPHYEYREFGIWKELAKKYEDYYDFKKTWSDNDSVATVSPTVNIKDSWVYRLQIELNKYFGANLVVDSIFSAKTLKACPVIKKGNKGSIVYLVQERLKDANCFENGALDGVFGDHTLKMVKGFQAYYKLSQDGIVGQNTWSALSKVRQMG